MKSGNRNRQDRKLPGHVWALGLLGAVLGVWAIAMALLAFQADLPDEASGTVLVIFEPSQSDNERLLTVARADGVVVTQTSLPNTWLVHSRDPGFAGRLRAAGATAVYRNVDMASVALGGCFGATGNPEIFLQDARRRSDL